MIHSRDIESNYITLAVLVHNPFKSQLLAMLESCLRQTMLAPLVIVDDSPHPAEWLNAWLKQYPHVRYVSNTENKNGFAGNWNYAVAQSNTSWISILHQDDMLEPDYVKEVCELRERNPSAAAVFTHARVINAVGNRSTSLADLTKQILLYQYNGQVYEIKGETGLQRLLRGNTIFCPALCVKRELANEIKFDPRWRMVPDLNFICSVLLRDGVLVGTKSQQYVYRRHAHQATAVYQGTLERFNEELLLFNELEHAAREKGWSQAARTARQARIIKLHICADIITSLIKLRIARVRALWRVLLSY